MEEVYRAYPAKMSRFVSAALRSVLSLLLVAFPIPFRIAAGTEFAANRSQASTLSASDLETAGRLFGDPQTRSGNPIITGWYADPEAHIFKNEYWIYPTYSAAYENQVFFDAFSSKDLITWKKHPRIFANVDAPWVKRALWAPSVVEKGGWYYLFFGANDIQNDQQLGGIGIARSRQPGGPFKDYLGIPLIDKFHNGAQPIFDFITA